MLFFIWIINNNVIYLHYQVHRTVTVSITERTMLDANIMKNQEIANKLTKKKIRFIDVAPAIKKEIAAELGISSRTVKRFVSSLLEKTGYSNRTRLAIAVTKKNFILPHLEE